MKIKNRVFTIIAFLFFLANVAYVALFAVNLFIASLLELPCNGDGIYLLFSIISIGMLVMYPIVATIINLTCVALQAIAIYTKESKIINLIMMAITVLSEVGTIALTVRFWEGAMGV